VMCNR